MYFPKIIQLLNERRASLLEKKGGRFVLIEKNPKTDPDSVFDLFTDKEFSPFSDKFIKYVFTSKLANDDMNVKTEFGLDNESSFRLSSLLIALFSVREDKNMLNAVQLERNFYRLMRMTYAEDDFTETEFKEILSASDEVQLYPQLNLVLKSKKTSQLLKRIEYHNAETQDELQVIAKSLFYLVRNEEEYDLDLVTIYDQLSQIFNINFSDEQHIKIDSPETFISNVFFDDKMQKPQYKLELILYLFRNIDTTGLWGYKLEALEEKGLRFFEEYLEPIKNDFWEMIDLSAYYFYDTLLEHTKSAKIKEVFLDFLATCSIDKFCSQMLVNEPFTFLRYKLSDRVKFIFGSNEKFIEFLESHKNKNKGVEEFLRYLRIMEVGNFDTSKKFIFKYLPGRDFLGNNRLSKKDKEDAENLVQVHIKLTPALNEFRPDLTSKVFNKPLGHQDFFASPDGKKAEKYIVFGSLDYEAKDLLTKLFSEIHKQLEREHYTKLTLNINFKSRTATIKNEGLTLVELIEIQYGKAPDGWKYSND
ncbi:MAG: rubrerythrin [Bacteroidia bacterium]|jgi:rubrerythrin